MSEKKEYRSAVRSRRLIRESLISLLKEKDISRITVKEIVERADLNRATFYAHYPDVRGVMEEFENETVEHLKAVLSGVQFEQVFHNPMPFLTKINHLLEENLDFYKTLMLANESDRFIEKLKAIYLGYLDTDANIPDSIRDTPAFQIQTKFFADGLIGIYKRWFHGELSGSLDDIALQLSKIISTCAQAYEKDFSGPPPPSI